MSRGRRLGLGLRRRASVGDHGHGGFCMSALGAATLRVRSRSDARWVTPPARAPTLSGRGRSSVALMGRGAGVTRRDEVRGELAPDVGAPDLLRVAAELAKRGIEPGEEDPEVLNVSLQKRLGAAVVRSENDLRKVDQDRPVPPKQDIERRQIAMDQIRRQHLDDLLTKLPVHRRRALVWNRRLDQARSRMTLGIDHHLHQQDALVKHHGLRNANAEPMELVKRVGFGGFPRIIRGLLPEATPLLYRALGAAVPDLAPFLVRGILAKAPMLPVEVHLGGDDFLAAPHQPDLCLLAGLQTANHFIDDSIRQEWIKSLFHRVPGIIRLFGAANRIVPPPEARSSLAVLDAAHGSKRRNPQESSPLRIWASFPGSMLPPETMQTSLPFPALPLIAAATEVAPAPSATIRLRSTSSRMAAATSPSDITSDSSSSWLTRGHISSRTVFPPIPSTKEGV